VFLSGVIWTCAEGAGRGEEVVVRVLPAGQAAGLGCGRVRTGLPFRQISMTTGVVMAAGLT
jgi:hypothetical protein